LPRRRRKSRWRERWNQVYKLAPQTTKAQYRLAEALRQRGIEPLLEAPVKAGGREWRVDLLIPPRLCIEVDGLIHYRRDQRLRDEEKDAALKSAGYEVLRVSNAEVLENLNSVVKRILQKLKAIK